MVILLKQLGRKFRILRRMKMKVKNLEKALDLAKSINRLKEKRDSLLRLKKEEPNEIQCSFYGDGSRLVYFEQAFSR
jgi:DNA mismatch repair ATPase MutS